MRHLFGYSIKNIDTDKCLCFTKSIGRPSKMNEHEGYAWYLFCDYSIFSDPV